MSWPLKYRPRSFDELALQDVRSQLKKLVGAKNVPQVFLFAGPKGSGKTSTSRIISAYLNQDLDNEEQEKIFGGSSFVVQEMDAASNRGIDDIRLLKERVVMPPPLGQKAVYILDEAHMLTKEAFNALLKLLEEPPAHAVFILATTELHKVPETIISRANLVKFRQATAEELNEVLAKILAKEKIEFEPEALNKVVERADGSFRDAVKLLEMVCRGEKRLTSASLEVLGSLTLKEDLKALVNAVVGKDERQVIDLVQAWRDQGEDEKYVFKALLEFLHEDLVMGLGAKDGQAAFATKVNLFLLDSLVTLPQVPSPIAFLNLEVKLLDLIFKAKTQATGGGSAPKVTTKIVTAVTPVKKNSPELKIQAQIEPIEPKTDVVQSNNLTPSPLKDFVSDNLVEPDDETFVSLQGVWSEFLQAVESQNLTLAAIIKSGKLLPDPGGITKIGVYYQFHKLQLEQQKQLHILQNCGREVAGGLPKFEFVLLQPKQPPTSPQKTDQVDKIDDGLESAVSEALL